MFTHPYEGMKFTLNETTATGASRGVKELPVILIVDDESINNYFLKVILRDHASEIYIAVNGKEAVDLCHQHPEISLILMDVKMPVMDGYTATRLIRVIRPEVPVIAFTAYAMSGDEHLALEAGCNDYLAKPVLKEDLMRMMEKYC
jgi:CheY-like chemotaxis protein